MNKYNYSYFKDSLFTDRRGFLWTSWEQNNNKIKLNFNHDKFSISKKNVLRGLHGDKKSWKLISCVYGKLFFVIVNYNKSSPNYLKYYSWILSHNSNESILVPPNFLNGHLCLSRECVFHYKLSYKGIYFDTNKQFSVNWNNKKIGIKWPIKKPILSARDRNAEQ